MKKIFLIIILGISNISLSQRKTIEILVKDTINLKTKSYEILVKDNLNIYEIDKNKEHKIIENSNNKVLNFIKKENYKILENENYSQSLNFEEENLKNFIVLIDNNNKTSEFFKKIKKNNLLGFITNVNFKKSERDEKRLYEKLFKKADNRIKLLSEIQNFKIKERIEISETKAYKNNTSNFLENVIKNDNSLDINRIEQGILTKSISIKYIIE